jgi:hypothetical protein
LHSDYSPILVTPALFLLPIRIRVTGRHRETVVGHVQQEITPYNAQSDYADFMSSLWTLIRHCFASSKMIAATGFVPFTVGTQRRSGAV